MRKPYSIGHAAKLAGVSVSTLRSWENHGLMVPQKSESGHRYYSTEDVERAQRIERYRSISGMSISSIKRQLARDDEESAGQGASGRSGQTAGSAALGARVRSLRKQMGWSMRELSERSEISQSQLSTFERGHAFLGSARLNTLAALFGKGLTELLGGTVSGDSPVFRQGSGRIVEGMGDGVRIEQVTVAERLLDAEFWTIAPGGESDGFYSHEGEELIYVIDGQFELTLADSDAEILGAGDCAYFNSRVEHRWRNPGAQPTTLLWVNTDSDRLAAMRFAKADRKLGLGAGGNSLGEGSLTVDLPKGVETYRTIETHTAGHVTRVLIEPLPGLDQSTLAEKVEYFRANYDHIRALLLGEPRGHAGAFGLIPVNSAIADFGAFFVASYGYPEMGNHAIVGYARVLASLGRLAKRKSFTIEVPSGIVSVELGRFGDPANVTITFPEVGLRAQSAVAELTGKTIAVEVGTDGTPAALVDAKALGIALVPENTADLTELAAHVRTELQASSGVTGLDSIVFYEDGEAHVSRQFVAINNQKFDRSPGILGAATRAAQLVRDGRAEAGAVLSFESIFGDTIRAEVAPDAALRRDAKVEVKVTAQSHLNAISTFIYEPSDHLYVKG